MGETDRQDGPVEIVLRLVDFGHSIVKRFSAHRVSLAAGGMASFVTMAIAPAAIAFGSIMGLIWSPHQIRKVVRDLFTNAIPMSGQNDELGDAIGHLIETASSNAVSFGTFVGFLVAIYSASKVVRDGRYAFDASFGLPPRTSGIIGFVSAAVITLVALIAAAAVAVVLAFVPRILEAMSISYSGLLRFAHIAVTAALIYVGILFIYRWAARGSARIAWLSTGAGFSLLWVAAVTIGIGLFANPSGSVGATMVIFGAPIILLFWSYFSFLGVLIGAEVEAELSLRGGLRAVLTSDTSARGFVMPTPAQVAADEAQHH